MISIIITLKLINIFDAWIRFWNEIVMVRERNIEGKNCGKIERDERKRVSNKTGRVRGTRKKAGRLKKSVAEKEEET